MPQRSLKKNKVGNSQVGARIGELIAPFYLEGYRCAPSSKREAFYVRFSEAEEKIGRYG